LIVVDASVVVEAFLRRHASATIDRIFSAERVLHAPQLLDLEVAQVIRRYALRGEITQFRARQMLDLLRKAPMARYPHTPLLPRIWELRENLTAYDAAYVALAEALRGTLLTCDERIARAPGIRASVEVVG
jgi:predicted nucleic acid-binding protein